MTELWSTLVFALQEEFSDINDLTEGVQIAVRLLVALVLGGLIGYDREHKGKSAGLRTHMLVALSASIFVIAPALSGMEVADMSRVLQGIIAGIGFLGAGTIINSRGSDDVKGLTTAASIWLAAALSITARMEREMLALVRTLFALCILSVLSRLQKRVEQTRTCTNHAGSLYIRPTRTPEAMPTAAVEPFRQSLSPTKSCFSLPCFPALPQHGANPLS